MTPQEICAAFGAGKKLQYKRASGEWEDVTRPSLFAYRLQYSGDYPDLWRIATETKRVPLGPEDFPPGTVVRKVGWTVWDAVIACTNVGVYAGVANQRHVKPVPYFQLTNHEKSTDFGKTWQPCWKEVEE